MYFMCFMCFMEKIYFMGIIAFIKKTGIVGNSWYNLSCSKKSLNHVAMVNYLSFLFMRDNFTNYIFSYNNLLEFVLIFLEKYQFVLRHYL